MLTLKEAVPELAFQPVFDEIRRTLYPVYRYLQGNCHCNAHLASLILRSRGIAHKKIWIFAPSRYSVKSNESFRIYDRNQISPNGWINWGYHVAPMISIEGKDFIFDYNFSETSPLSLSEWLSYFCLNKFKCVIEGQIISFSIPVWKMKNRYLTTVSILWRESVLKMAGWKRVWQ